MLKFLYLILNPSKCRMYKNGHRTFFFKVFKHKLMDQAKQDMSGSKDFIITQCEATVTLF